MSKQIKAYYIDPETNTAEPRTIEDSLTSFYQLLHCSSIEIVTRRIGAARTGPHGRGYRRYSIICDEEGALLEDPKISAINDYGDVMLVGSLLIVGLPDDEGELTDLMDEDIKHIRHYVMPLSTRRHPEGWYMLTSCDYE